ncbi:MAG TPA: Lon-like protease helical domain-containing protein [Alphaproteobacteria bacterium]|nr:Lon-like protease helical domain-containing protein [Alphaproteobacteria bacterium]
MTDPLPPERLYRRCEEGAFAFSTTAELPELDEMVWQQRAVDAIGLAIAIRRPGYNMCVLGPTGTGKRHLVREMLERRSREEPTPDDWCYVNNFAAPQNPRALRLPAGRARALKEAMAALIGELKGALPAAFESEDYRARRQVIEAQFKRIHERAFQAVQKEAEAEGVGLIRTPMGLALAPTGRSTLILAGRLGEGPAILLEHPRPTARRMMAAAARLAELTGGRQVLVSAKGYQGQESRSELESIGIAARDQELPRFELKGLSGKTSDQLAGIVLSSTSPLCTAPRIAELVAEFGCAVLIVSP